MSDKYWLIKLDFSTSNEQTLILYQQHIAALVKFTFGTKILAKFMCFWEYQSVHYEYQICPFLDRFWYYKYSTGILYKTMYSSKAKPGIPKARVVPKSVQYRDKLALNEHLIVYSKYRFCHCTWTKPLSQKNKPKRHFCCPEQFFHFCSLSKLVGVNISYDKYCESCTCLLYCINPTTFRVCVLQNTLQVLLPNS